MTGIWTPMVMAKKVCQRPVDQASSLRWDLIWPSQLIDLKKRIHRIQIDMFRPIRLDHTNCLQVVIKTHHYLGGILFLRLKVSHLRPTWSIESSTVDTIRCCERRHHCSARRKPGNISLRSRKVYQWLSICWVTLYCEGMKVTTTWETELSSLTKKSWKRRLNCGMESGTVCCC